MSGPAWRRVEWPRAHELVVEQIERQLATGALRVGDRLPGERELASLVGVSRTAVREAFRVLETQGALTSSVGADGGTVVAAVPREALARLLRLHVFLGIAAGSEPTAPARPTARANAVVWTPAIGAWMRGWSQGKVMS